MQLVLDVFAVAPAYVYAGVFVVGLLIGSFLNVVIYRLPKMMHHGYKLECQAYLAEAEGKTTAEPVPTEAAQPFNLATPRSTCPKCNAAIKAWQNIPVISYLLLKGKCHKCGVHIPKRYPLVELSCGLLSLLVVAVFGATNQAWFGLILLWCLICLTMIDVDHQLLPDSITLPLLWLGLLVNIFNTNTSLQNAVIGAMAGYLSLWSVYWLFKLATNKEGMGFGDFKLLAALGAWLGWVYLPVIIILSSLVGAVLGIGAIVIFGRDKAKPMPFGPYLAIAGFIAFLWGDAIINNYLGFFNLAA